MGDLIHAMNISAFDLNLLPVFEALYEERSVSRAATRVGLSQPALSNAIRRMREALNDPLFVRTGRGMRPTPRAERLAGTIQASLAQARVVISDYAAFQPSSAQRTFRIAMNDYAEWRFQPALARALSPHSDGLRLQFRRLEALFTMPEPDLRNGSVDLAIGFLPDPRNLNEGTLSETLFEEGNVVIARRRHPTFKKRITAEQFAAFDHAAVIYRNEPWGFIDQELAALGLRRRLRLATPHFLSVLRTVAESDLVACVPETLAREFQDNLRLSIAPLPLPLPRFTTRMVWSGQWRNDLAHDWLREQVRQAVKIALRANVATKREAKSRFNPGRTRASP